MVRDTVRAWVDDALMPVIGDAYIERRFPKELIPEMGELGALGANLPEEYGCAGLNNVAYGLIMQELERGDSGIRSFASVQGALVMYPIYAFGSEEQKKTWLPKLAGRGDRLLRADRARLRLEPGRHDHHRARRRGRLGAERRQDVDHQRLHGRRGGRVGQTGDIDDVKGIRGFVVPTDTKGFSAKDQKGKLSLLASTRASSCSRTCSFRRTPCCRKLGGLKSPLMCLTQARYGIAWGAVGAAMACFDEAVVREGARHVRRPDRRQADPAGAARDMLTEITKGQLLCCASAAEGRGHDDAAAGVARQAQQREHGHETSRARRAGCSAATASSSSTTRCGTWRTSRASTPTRGRTTSTR
jgi:glutaryl-CoA dehydrogenase